MPETYTFTNEGTVLPETLDREIVEAGLPKPLGSTHKSTGSPNLWIRFESVLDAGQQTTLQATVEAHDGELEVVKKRKVESIDARTGELISLGFGYNSRKFSLSNNAQHNWIGLHSAGQAGLLSFPTSVTAQDGDGEYVIQDLADLVGLYQTGVGTVKYHYDGGRAVIKQVRAAATVNEVAAVVDPR